jgi:hypothetical protein
MATVQCPFCKANVPRAHVRNHVEDIHRNLKPLAWLSISAAAEHVKTHSTACMLCGHKFSRPNKEVVGKHLRTAHPIVAANNWGGCATCCSCESCNGSCFAVSFPGLLQHIFFRVPTVPLEELGGFKKQLAGAVSANPFHGGSFFVPHAGMLYEVQPAGLNENPAFKLRVAPSCGGYGVFLDEKNEVDESTLLLGYTGMAIDGTNFPPSQYTIDNVDGCPIDEANPNVGLFGAMVNTNFDVATCKNMLDDATSSGDVTNILAAFKLQSTDTPNVEARREHKNNYAIGLYSCRPIQPGEELRLSYGPNYPYLKGWEKGSGSSLAAAVQEALQGVATLLGDDMAHGEALVRMVTDEAHPAEAVATLAELIHRLAGEANADASMLEVFRQVLRHPVEAGHAMKGLKEAASCEEDARTMLGIMVVLLKHVESTPPREEPSKRRRKSSLRIDTDTDSDDDAPPTKIARKQDAATEFFKVFEGVVHQGHTTGDVEDVEVAYTDGRREMLPAVHVVYADGTEEDMTARDVAAALENFVEHFPADPRMEGLVKLSAMFAAPK